MNNELLIDSKIKKDIPVNINVLKNYIGLGEKIIGFGLGGSESLTIFLNKPGSTTKVVRKILSDWSVNTISYLDHFQFEQFHLT